MTEIGGGGTQRARSPRSLQALYAALLLSALALATLVLGDIVYAFESSEDADGHEHGFYAPIFDLAWIVFLPTFLVTLIAGALLLVVGQLRGSGVLKRFGARALIYCTLAVLVVAVAELLGA